MKKPTPKTIPVKLINIERFLASKNRIAILIVGDIAVIFQNPEENNKKPLHESFNHKTILIHEQKEPN